MATIVWMTGLSGSGKSTISRKLKERMENSVILDGDIIRSGLCKGLGFSIEDRKENISRIAYVAKIILDNNINVIVPAITPTNDLRDTVKSIVGNNLIMAWIRCPLSICEGRDVKGLYGKARNGEIKNFTGIDSPFDEPNDYDVICDTENLTIDDCSYIILNHLYRTTGIRY